jgi:hypothetical protein
LARSTKAQVRSCATVSVIKGRSAKPWRSPLTPSWRLKRDVAAATRATLLDREPYQLESLERVVRDVDLRIGESDVLLGELPLDAFSETFHQRMMIIGQTVRRG